VVLHLDNDTELWFVDPRTFGEVVVFDPANVEVEIPDLARLGPDPIADEITLRSFREMLRTRSRQLKPLLLDQHVIAGIGNIYADEILHAARLRPDRPSDSLSTVSERRLHESIHRILRDAISAGGSTLSDAQYVDLFGGGGSYQDDHHVYGRAGERCRTCGLGWIRHTVSAQRSTHYCPRCQR
jgi:formamidopyrimidine-DNA glycosylase